MVLAMMKRPFQDKQLFRAVAKHEVILVAPVVTTVAVNFFWLNRIIGAVPELQIVPIVVSDSGDSPDRALQGMRNVASCDICMKSLIGPCPTWVNGTSRLPCFEIAFHLSCAEHLLRRQIVELEELKQIH